VRHFIDRLCVALEDALEMFNEGVSKMDGDIFYKTLRPFIGGFSKGVIFQGVGPDGCDIVVNHEGPSGGQQAVFLLLDCVLAVKHSNAGRNWQKQVHAQNYKPHGNFVTSVYVAFEGKKTLREWAEEGSKWELAAYRKAVATLLELRKVHVGAAIKMLKATSTGTGGSTWTHMLRSINRATGEALI